MTSFGKAIWKLTFELSPIILVNGVAQYLPGGMGNMIPIVALTETLNLADDLLTGGNISLDNFFAHYRPLPGATLVDQDLGRYPFANQAVAANATIQNPLRVSLQMICPIKQRLGYFTKLATMIALQATLSKHNALGGTYVVATPSFFYSNCVLKTLTDVTANGESAQAQVMWQFDFEAPLLTLNQADEAQNSLLSKLTNGTQLSGDPQWSGAQSVAGNTSSLAGMSANAALGGAGGASIAPPQGIVSS